MSQRQHDEVEASPLFQSEPTREKRGDGSFVGSQAAQMGISSGVLQRKIQRRAEERHSGGPVGGEHAGGAVGGAVGGPGAGEQEDPHVTELKTKVGKLASERFGGDYKKAFDHYDTDHDGAISRDELSQLLKDAGIGNGFTRGAWVGGIIDKMDAGKDGKISWAEFQAGLHG